jgi:tyrosinase
MYPSAATQIPELAVHSGLQAAIASPGEQDLYKFAVAKAGTYVVETGGTSDVYLSLFGPDSQVKLLAQDDDSGAGSNSRIEVSLQPGTYYVQVRHYNPNSTGPYRIWVAG